MNLSASTLNSDSPYAEPTGAEVMRENVGSERVQVGKEQFYDTYGCSKTHNHSSPPLLFPPPCERELGEWEGEAGGSGVCLEREKKQFIYPRKVRAVC